MEKYLAIITTVLVVTQIVRVAQNHIQLHRQNKLYKEQLGELADLEIKKADFNRQRNFYILGLEYFEKKLKEYGEDDDG